MNARLPNSALPVAALSREKASTVFKSGNSQAVRIPKEFQFSTKHVKIMRRGNELVIKPKYLTWGEVLANLPPLDPNEDDGFDLAQIVRESNAKMPPERDLSHLFDDMPAKSVRKSRTLAPVPKKAQPRKPKAKA